MLDAAARVVSRDGAAGLTIEAVAREAGISKASVLYDAKTKQALVEAVIVRAFERDDEHHRHVEAGLAAGGDAAIRGRIAGAKPLPDPAFRSAALHLSAALVLDENLRRHMQDRQRATIARILAESSFPRVALLAYLATEGLKFLENLDFHHFEPAERARILTEIARLADGEIPDPTNAQETEQ
jgi:AcrR family transcriptional regulator